MVIYMPIEVQVRELPGYLLFAAVAASRGHQVVIASSTDLWLYKRLNILKKGVYFIKNINISPASAKIYRSFTQAGFDFYCQEQEPAILRKTFDHHVSALNITKNQEFPFKAVFCWGDRCAQSYRQFFSTKRDVFLNTGSLRIEVIKEKFFGPRNIVDKSEKRPYVMFVSNFGLTMGKKHWTDLLVQYQTTVTTDHDLTFLSDVQHNLETAVCVILAAKHLSKKFPEYDIVVRPHPTEDPGHWRKVLGGTDGIRVIDNTDSISPWIHNASIVIQNGCTTAFESVIQKVPVISFGPDRLDSTSNTLGVRAKTLEELDHAFNYILKDKDYEAIQLESESIVSSIMSFTGENPALEMLRVMEERSPDVVKIKVGLANTLKIHVANMLNKGRNWAKTIFRPNGEKELTTNLNKMEVINELAHLSAVLDVPAPKATFVGSSSIIIG